MRVKFKIIILLLITLLLTGCGDQRIYERLGFILNLGIDTAGDDKMLFTYSSPVIEGKQGSKDGGEENKIEVNMEIGDLLREGRDTARQISPRSLEAGKIQNVLFGIDAAKKGMHNYLEIFERDLSNPVQAWTIIVDGKANELIKGGKEFKDKPRLAFYINQLIENNSENGYCPGQTVISYNIENMIPGIDPIVPMIRMEKDGVRVMGAALIDGDILTGRINTQETAFLMIVMGKSRNSELVLDLPEDLAGIKKKIVVLVRKVKTKSKIDISSGTPKVSFNVDIKLIMDEYMWDNLSDQKKKEQLSESLSKGIKNRLNELFKKLLDANCDAIGIGDKVRAYHNSYWKNIGGEVGWKKVFPKVTADFTVNAHLQRYGVIQ